MSSTTQQRVRWREGLWAIAFLFILAAMLAPLLVWAQATAREISIPQQALLILIATGLCQWLRNRPLSETIGRLDGRWLFEAVVGCLIGAALMLVPAALLLLSGSIAWAIQPASTGLILSAVMAMAAVAVAEELLFRGFLFQRLAGALGIWPAQLAIAALFLLTHLGNPGLHGMVKAVAAANIFLASILFGLAWLRTASLAMPIGIHFSANSVQGIVLGLAVSGNGGESLLAPSFRTSSTWLTGGAFGLEGSLPGLLILIGFLVLFALAKDRPVFCCNRSILGKNHAH